MFPRRLRQEVSLLTFRSVLELLADVSLASHDGPDIGEFPTGKAFACRWSIGPFNRVLPRVLVVWPWLTIRSYPIGHHGDQRSQLLCTNTSAAHLISPLTLISPSRFSCSGLLKHSTVRCKFAIFPPVLTADTNQPPVYGHDPVGNGIRGLPVGLGVMVGAVIVLVCNAGTTSGSSIWY